MNPYFQPLAHSYQQNANPENAFWMKKYLRNQFDFFGIKSPDRTLLNRGFFSHYGLPERDDLEEIIQSLMHEPQREFHYFALSLTGKMKKQWNDNTWRLFEKMALTKPWWDTVDALAVNDVGQFFRMFPEYKQQVTSRWNQSDNIWLIRSSILFQLKYKNDTDADLLFSYIRPHLDSKEFFVQKAIGWALRQYARTNPEAVMEFVNSHELPPLSKREALKHFRS